MSTLHLMSLTIFPAFLAFALPEQSADPALPKAESVLAQLEAAIGDGPARAKVVNVVMTGTMTFAGLPGEGTVEEVYVAPERVKQTIGFGKNYGSTIGSTGAWSWSTDPAMGITIKEGDEQGSVKRLFAIGRRAPWNTLYARAETVRKTEHEKRPHWELRMIPKSGAPETWFVDCESHVLSRVDLALPNPQGGVIPMQFHFADFKQVDGILYPHVKKQVVGELAIVSTYTSITHPDKVDEARVAPPADVAEAFANPKKRAMAIPDDLNACKLETIEAKPAATIQ